MCTILPELSFRRVSSAINVGFWCILGRVSVGYWRILVVARRIVVGVWGGFWLAFGRAFPEDCIGFLRGFRWFLPVFGEVQRVFAGFSRRAGSKFGAGRMVGVAGRVKAVFLRGFGIWMRINGATILPRLDALCWFWIGVR